MARLAPIAFLFAALLSMALLATPTAKADGKIFLSIATDTGSGSTMPRQRAIIAFKHGEQRMAIDTAFTGAGEEFAWLVPLPSEPEILPATKGMFDTVDLLTAPRVNGRMVPDVVIAPAVLIIITVLVMIWCKARGLWPVLILFAILLFPFFAMPLLTGSARGGPTIGQARFISSSQSARMTLSFSARTVRPMCSLGCRMKDLRFRTAFSLSCRIISTAIGSSLQRS